jgi:hypothetical protein
MDLRAGRQWIAFAALAWTALAVGIGIHAALYPQTHTVYDIYSLAARNWWAGNDLYVGGHEHYRYSPLFAIAITPLALLPDWCGTPLWKVGNIVLYALAVRAFARQVLPASLTRQQIGALFLLVLPLSVHSMQIGQANLTVVSACLFALSAALAGGWNTAALCVAAATLIKGYPLALGLLLIALYPRRFGGRFLVALAIGLLAPFAAGAPSRVMAQNISWLRHLRDSTVIMRERLRSIDHLFEVFGQPLTPSAFALLGLVAGSAVLALCVYEAWRSSDGRQLLTRVFLLFASWVVLFGPATETCTYVMVAPAIAWSVIDAYRRPTSRLAQGLLIASLIMMGPLVTDAFGGAIRNFAGTHGSQPIGALLYLAYLLGSTRRSSVSTAQETPTAQAAGLAA